MMNRMFSPGRLIALPLCTIVTVFLWGVLFPPGGSGSNIIIMLVAAGSCVYYGTLWVGRYLDTHIFHGGSRKRATQYFASEKLFHTLKQKWGKKSGLSDAFTELDQALTSVKQDWNKPELAPKQIALLSHASERLQQRINEATKGHKKWLNSSGASLVFALLAAIGVRVFLIEPFQIPSGSMIPTLLVGDHLFVVKLRYGIMNPFSREPKYLVRWATPKPGQVIIFQAPDYVGSHAGDTWIKRVIAGPGQTVRLANTVVYVDDQPYKHMTPDEEVRYMDYFNYGSPGLFLSGGTGFWREQEAIFTREEIPHAVTHAMYSRLPDQRLPFEADWPLPDTNLPGLHCNESSCTVDEGHIFVMGDNRGNSSDGRVWGALPIENVKGQALLVWMSVDGSQQSVELGHFTVPDFRWSRWMSLIH